MRFVSENVFIVFVLTGFEFFNFFHLKVSRPKTFSIVFVLSGFSARLSKTFLQPVLTPWIKHLELWFLLLSFAFNSESIRLFQYLCHPTKQCVFFQPFSVRQYGYYKWVDVFVVSKRGHSVFEFKKNEPRRHCCFK